MNGQTIEIEIGELALTAPPALLRKLAATLERELGEIVTRELERRIAAQGPEWRPAQVSAPDTINVTVAGRQLSGHAVGSAVVDVIWGGLSR
jgi:protein required for attachment to host cells